MKWKKLGKIFDPTEYKLANNCKEFAQSPQALVFDDFVRIYFTTREVDTNGKYLGHIAFVDIDKTFKKVLQVSDKTVIPLGELGSFDEHGIFPMNVVRYNDRILGYTSGLSRRISVPLETSIGLATSEDNGLTFQRHGTGPVLTSSLYEPFLVCDAFVAVFEGVYHMWYIYGLRWLKDAESNGAPSRVYKIAHAISKDGITWEKEGRLLIDDKLGENECQALPTVVYHNSRYHMFFCYRQPTGFRNVKDRGYRIGYAFSDDLVNWTRNDDEVGIDVTENDWDSDMMCYPHVFKCDGKVYLLYNGNQFGRLGFGIAELEDNNIK
jgi:sucrose-6-phosphate hydrolase SacC (GH32 family)